ncbi:MAG: hypothetical protein WCF18_25150 [Chthoniobacteraceae bacterium]
MKINPQSVSLFSIACASVALAADAGHGSKQLQIFPKNLARQHLGSNLFIFNPANQTYTPTEAAAAWLDDDATTGWPVMAGKQSYLLVLSEPEVLANFSISARPATGTISLFAGDEPMAPGGSSWKPLVKNVPFESVNDKKLGKSFNHFAKYLLIQTDVADPGPLYSLYVFGDKPAASYSFRKREQSIDARAIFGQFVNNQTDFNLSALHTGARVSYANSTSGYVAWQRAIDDNPETAVALAGSGNESGAVVSFDKQHTVSRITVLADAGAKGKLDVYALASPVASTGPGAAVALEAATPTVSVLLDGTTGRSSIDFPAIEAGQLALRWSPATPGENLNVREFSAFNAVTLDDYEVSLSPEVVAEYRPASSKSSEDSSSYEPSGDGKESKDFKDPKKNPEPVAIGPGGSPYLPGALGFPPNPTSRRVRIPPSVSP